MKGATARAHSAAETRGRRNASQRATVRDRLVTTARRLFAERRLASVSVEDILVAAKVSRRTFYAYFANKFELAASIINAALDDGSAILAGLEQRTPEAILPGIVNCYLHLWSSHREALSIINTLEPEVMPYVEDNHRKFGTAIKALLAKAEKAGWLRNDDATVTFKVISRTAIPLLKIYDGNDDGDRLYRDAMLALLGKHA